MGGTEEMFKGANLQLVDKSRTSNVQHSDCRQQYCIINLQVAKRLKKKSKITQPECSVMIKAVKQPQTPNLVFWHIRL